MFCCEGTDSAENSIIGHSNTQNSISEKIGSYKIHDRVFHNNFVFKIGDIVSLNDDDCKYFAQVKIFIEDSYCQKYAAVIWLIPTLYDNESREFHPNLFMLGPQDESLYKVEELEFVMHSPNSHYNRFLKPVPRSTNFLPTVRYKPKSRRKI